MADDLPLLLHFRVSHFNEKVRWALDRKRWPHRRRSLVPGFHVPRVRRLTGQNRVPVLVLDGAALHDSTAIIAELERRRPDPPLYPTDPEQRARALAIEEHFDEEVAPDLRRIFWACYLDRAGDLARVATQGESAGTRRAFRAVWPVMKPVFRLNMGLDRARIDRSLARLPGHFDRAEAELSDGEFLVGDAFSVADLTVASVLSAILRPPEFAYPLPEPQAPRLVELRSRFADHPATRWATALYARHRDPSSEVAG